MTVSGTHTAEPTWINLRSVLHLWDASLTPARVGPRAAVKEMGSRPSRRDARGSASPMAQHVMDARAAVLDALTDATAAVRRNVYGPWPKPPEHLGIRERVALLAPWADWLDVMHPHYAAALAAAVTRLERIVFPTPTDQQRIGYCPLAVPAADGHGEVTCGGPVNAYPDAPDIQGRVHYTSAVCLACRTDAVLSWWARALKVAEHKPLVTAKELVSILAFEAGLATTTSTIRTWVDRGVIKQHSEPGPRGVRLFDRAAALTALRDRSILA